MLAGKEPSHISHSPSPPLTPSLHSMTSVSGHVLEMRGPSYVTSTLSPPLDNSNCANSLPLGRSGSLITLE